MDKIYDIETQLTGDLAELYAAIMEEFEERTDISLSEMNRTLLQTGLIQHLVMMQGLGLLDTDRGARVSSLVDGLARAGITEARARELDLPILYAGLGESSEDLVPFDPDAFVDGILAG